jgi:peptidoglycan/xylan/chitin deacetylase (PgdA/CDA1 family)
VTGIAVLGYHSIGDKPRGGILRWCVSPRDFDEQMALLRQRRLTPLTVSHYADLLARGGPMPPRPVLITFDDGYADLATTALPVLRRYAIAATAYLITARLRSPEEGFLRREQVRDLRAAGVEIGSHGHTHRPLDCLRRAEALAEAVLSKRILEVLLDAPVRSFAYPYGYHGAAVRRAVRAAGYDSACAVKNALSHRADDPFAIARVLVERDTGADGVAAVLDGRGAPLAWRGERLRTRGWRTVRRARRAWTTGCRGPSAWADRS